MERIVTDVDLDAGMSVALPALRHSLQEVLTADTVHAVVVALLPARGLTVEKIAGVLAECSVAAGKPVVAAFSGLLDPSIYVEGMVGDRGRINGGSLLLQPRRGGGRAGIRGPLRPVAGPRPGPVRGTRGLRPGRHARRAGAAAGTRSGGEQLVRLDAETAAGLLARYGIRVVPSVGFDTADEAVAAADRLGWPVALKTTDPALRHRLDLGGVRLDIQDADSLRRNVLEMRRSLERYGSPSLEVQTMAPVGQACTFRAIEDPLLGPVVSFGLAGDAVNLLDDWAHRVPPLSGSDLHDFIRAPRASRKLFGYQGLPAVDARALEDLAARLTRLKDNHPEIALVDFNPVLAGPEGASILSADVRIANAAQRTDSARRAMRS